MESSQKAVMENAKNIDDLQQCVANLHAEIHTGLNANLHNIESTRSLESQTTDDTVAVLKSITDNIIVQTTSSAAHMDFFNGAMKQCHVSLQTDPKRDVSTGKTPRKRVFEIPQWELTKSHDELLEVFHERDKENQVFSSKLPLSRGVKRVFGDSNLED